MYCAYCGTRAQEGQNFCVRCGRAMSGSSGAEAQPAVTPGSAAFQGPAPAAIASPAAPPTTWATPAGYAATPFRTRLQSHLRTLGILWIVGSALRMVPALGMLFLGRMGFLFMPWRARLFVAPLMGGIGAFLTAASVAGLAAGWGLLDRRPWARGLALVLGCLALIDFPFGTALGIYTLWVLFSPGADVEYERLSNRAAG
jgi:hypothetical protein